MKLGLPHGMATGSQKQYKRHRERERESVTFYDLDLKVMQGHFHPYCVRKKCVTNASQSSREEFWFFKLHPLKNDYVIRGIQI